jgi:hypothetical protein
MMERRSVDQGAGLCWSVLDFLHARVQQTADCATACTFSIQNPIALIPETECDLQMVLPCQERRKSHLAAEEELGILASRRRFLGDLLRDCGFFAHMVLRQVRSDSASNRSVNPDSARKRSNVVELSHILPRLSPNVLPRRLQEAPGPPVEAPSTPLQALWVEVGCRQVQILVSEKERHDYGEDSKLAL